MCAASTLCGSSSIFSGYFCGLSIGVFPSKIRKKQYHFLTHDVCAKYVPSMHSVCTILPTESIKSSCPAVSIVLMTDSYDSANLGFVSHTQGDLPGLIRAARTALQLVTRGTKESARLGWPFLAGIFILKTMMFHEVTTVLNERKHLKMVIRSAPDAVSLILGGTEWLGLTALHCAL